MEEWYEFISSPVGEGRPARYRAAYVRKQLPDGSYCYFLIHGSIERVPEISEYHPDMPAELTLESDSLKAA